jgi:membrane protein DedA with SNARE-associated domain
VIASASVSSTITQWIAENGVYAVFLLMACDALFPVGGELVMLFAGALASGAVSGSEVSLLGVGFESGLDSYLVLSLAGTLGYLAGAVGGWAIGRSGGRPLIERHGRRIHLRPETFLRAERWFERFGLWAVFLGRIVPVVRSFISIPAGVFRAPLSPYALLTLAGSAIWCFSFAAVGWALGGSWESFHSSFGIADLLVAIAAACVALALTARLIRRRRSTPAVGESLKEASD